MTTEAEWQEQVIELLHLLGYQHMHVRRSVGKGQRWTTATNVTGWPDLVAWRHGGRRGQGRLLFIELKSEKGKLTDEQKAVHVSLRAAGQEVHVWRPSDLERAQRLLSYPEGVSDGPLSVS